MMRALFGAVGYFLFGVLCAIVLITLDVINAYYF